jgi:alkyldihydroxyacetonephosphate synthase
MGREMRWWGWGNPAHRSTPPPRRALAWLEGALGPLGDGPVGPLGLEEVRLAEPALPAGVRDRLVAAVGAGAVRDDREARVLHAAGKGYPDLVRQRAGDCEAAPDAVVFPAAHPEVRAVLEACAEAGVAVVPFGGGTSVVGGVAPLRGPFDAVVSLDLGRLDALDGLDERSQTAVVQAGVRGPELEQRLASRGFTLGHFPQSFEYVSIGGCVATRSAGQASTGYGRIDELVLGVRCAAPAGDLDLPARPASAAGPELRDLVVGSEGTLGVITSAALRVHPAPAERRYEGFMFPSFAAGAEALRLMEQRGIAPDVARLSDEHETRMSFALAGEGRLKGEIARLYLRRRHVEGGCLAIAGWEGSADRVQERRKAGAAVIGACGGVGLGRGPGRVWSSGRFHGPYLRDDLLDRGVMVETVETAAQWSELFTLYRAVGDALREHAPLVLCHISHLYPSGASLYFTFFTRQDRQAPIEQWRRAKAAACDAIVAAGGTITHHHAVGRDHAPWMPAEVGATGIAALRALKAELDPRGIMNPGKLLPEPGPTPS